MSEGRQYYLMHKNEVVVSLLMEEENGSILNISSEGNRELLPLGGNIFPKDLKCWWERRAVPVSQGNMKRILIQNGISLLPTDEEIRSLLGRDPMLAERVEMIVNAYRKKIHLLERFQNGERIYQRRG